ncbi:MAG: hypothetical protein HY362_01825 [Candidatus Aenigmarchaeota archaeon]|nr:hypothetical protein [Candidatus Aenigmarchaeota archaeon]
MGRAKTQPADQKPVFYLIVGAPGSSPFSLADADRGLHARYGPATLGCAAMKARAAAFVMGPSTTSVTYHPATMELEGFGGLSEPRPDKGSVRKPLQVLGAGYGSSDLVYSFPQPIVPLPVKGNFFVVGSRGRLFVDYNDKLADYVGGVAALFTGAVRYVDRGIPVPVRHVDRDNPPVTVFHATEVPAELEAIGDFSPPSHKLDSKGKKSRFKIAAVGFT